MLFYTSAYLFTESQNTSLCWAGAYPIVFLLYFALVGGMALGGKKKMNKSRFGVCCGILLKEVVNQSRNITYAVLL